MSAMASQITGVTILYPNFCSGANQRKYQSFALLALVRGIYRWPVNSPHKGPVTRKMFPFDNVIMWCLLWGQSLHNRLRLFLSWCMRYRVELDRDTQKVSSTLYTKPTGHPVQLCCSRKHILSTFEPKHNNKIWKCIWKLYLQNTGHFCIGFNISKYYHVFFCRTWPGRLDSRSLRHLAEPHMFNISPSRTQGSQEGHLQTWTRVNTWLLWRHRSANALGFIGCLAVCSTACLG